MVTFTLFRVEGRGPHQPLRLPQGYVWFTRPSLAAASHSCSEGRRRPGRDNSWTYGGHNREPKFI